MSKGTVTVWANKYDDFPKLPTNVLKVDRWCKEHSLGPYMQNGYRPGEGGDAEPVRGKGSRKQAVNWKKRKEKYSAQRERVKLRKEIGELGVIEDITRYYEQIVTDARCLIESVPSRIGALIGDDELRPVVVAETQSIIRNFLRTLARGMKSFNESGTSDGNAADVSN